jgi:hypothetical protein
MPTAADMLCSIAQTAGPASLLSQLELPTITYRGLDAALNTFLILSL